MRRDERDRGKYIYADTAVDARQKAKTKTIAS